MPKFSRNQFSGKKRVLASLLIGFVFIFLFKEGSQFIYKSKPESRVINTGNYYLSKSELSEYYDSDSFLFPYHLYLLQMDVSPENFKRYCLFILLLASGILIFYTAFQRDLFTTIFTGAFLLLSPIYLIQTTWIGFPDHLNFLLLVLLIVLLDLPGAGERKYLLLVPLFILGSWNHFYQFNISAFLVILTFFALNRVINYRIVIFSILAALVGRFSSILFFHLQDVEILGRREQVIQSMGIDPWIKMHSAYWHLTLLSFFNGLVFLFLENLFRKQFILLGIFVLASVVTFFTADTTRVFVNLFYPSWILYWLHRSKAGFEKKEKVLLTGLLVVAAIYVLSVDLYYKWGGRLIFLMG